MNATTKKSGAKAHRGRSIKNMQMFELAEALGKTLEELVGPKRAVLYPRNMFEVHFLRAVKKATPLQQAAINAILVGGALGFIEAADVEAVTQSADPLAGVLRWCDRLTPEQRAAMEARAVEDSARMKSEFGEVQAAWKCAA